MRYVSAISLLAILSFTSLPGLAQQDLPQGYFTSEANAIATGNGILVSIKKYNPTKDEIKNASKPSANAPMNYLTTPFDFINISMYDKGFESKLYSLDNEGKTRWDLTLGNSNKSVPSPIKLYNDFIFSGESVKDKNKVTIQKIDLDGKVIWQKELDSLHNVNDIYVEGDRISTLVSFDVSKRMDHGDGTFSENVYPIYFFVQLEVATGKIIKKEYQMMGNYLSGLKFSDPLINTDYSYFLHNRDSAAFLDITKQKSATIVSQNMSKENTILKLAAGTESYHLLTALALENNKTTYNLISDFYGMKKKYESRLPVDFEDLNRNFVYKNSDDKIIVVTGNSKNITITTTDMEGKTSIYKKIDQVISPVVAVAVSNDKVYVLQVEGRNVPGNAGRIKVAYH